MQSASITWKNTSLRMDRSVPNPFLMWWILESGTLQYDISTGNSDAWPSAPRTVLWPQNWILPDSGFLQHLALCVASPNCTYSSHFDVTPFPSRCIRVTLLSVSRFLLQCVCCLWSKQFDPPPVWKGQRDCQELMQHNLHSRSPQSQKTNVKEQR